MHGCLLTGENETLLIGRYAILRSANRETALVAQTWGFFRLLKVCDNQALFPGAHKLGTQPLSRILFIFLPLLFASQN